jgi:DNA repair protein RecO (recombination protein O)
LFPKCGARATGVHPISMQALKYLRHYQRSKFSEAQKAVLNPELNRELETVMQHYLTYLLERGLNTPPFMRRLRKENRERDSSGEAE